ncbi:MAG: MlaA family lipoprotein, partial [Gammaproteobacteria bacterium]
LVLPLLGPRTLRDTGGLLVDSSYDPLLDISDDEARWAVLGLKAVDTRAGLLKVDRMAEQSGVDKYNFIRDAYLQHRNNLVHDGKPPRTAPEHVPVSEQESLELELELERALQAPGK